MTSLQGAEASSADNSWFRLYDPIVILKNNNNRIPFQQHL